MSIEGHINSSDQESARKADYLFLRLTQVYLSLYQLNRSPLGKLLRLLNSIYILVTLRPHRTTAYISLVKEANNFVAEYKIEPPKPERRIGRLGVALRVLKYVITNPITCLQHASLYRIKQVIQRLLFGDVAQTAIWFSERFPSGNSDRQNK
jgi:hypothetical protein